jgi:hypothetical protein
MRRLVTSLMLAGVLLSGSAVAAQGTSAGRGGDRQQPVGAAARARHGPEPLAAPPADVGMAEDPAPANSQTPVPPRPVPREHPKG